MTDIPTGVPRVAFDPGNSLAAIEVQSCYWGGIQSPQHRELVADHSDLHVRLSEICFIR